MPALAVPEPLTLQEPALSAWSPTAGGLPMSVQDQPDGQGDGEAGGEGAVPSPPTPIELMVDVAGVPFTPEVAKAPTVTESGMTTVAEPPGTEKSMTSLTSEEPSSRLKILTAKGAVF